MSNTTQASDTAAGSAKNSISWHHQWDSMQGGGEVLGPGRVLRVNEAVRRLRPCRVLSPSAAAAAADEQWRRWWCSVRACSTGWSRLVMPTWRRQALGGCAVDYESRPVRDDDIGLDAETRHTRRSSPVDWHNYVSTSLRPLQHLTTTTTTDARHRLGQQQQPTTASLITSTISLACSHSVSTETSHHHRVLLYEANIAETTEKICKFPCWFQMTIVPNPL